MNNSVKAIALVIIILICSLLYKVNTEPFFDYMKCNIGNDADACLNLAHRHSLIGKYFDRPKANKNYKKSCELGNVEGCSSLSSWYYSFGTFVRKEYSEFIKHSSIACDMGDDVACKNLGDYYERKKKDFSKAHKSITGEDVIWVMAAHAYKLAIYIAKEKA